MKPYKPSAPMVQVMIWCIGKTELSRCYYETRYILITSLALSQDEVRRMIGTIGFGQDISIVSREPRRYGSFETNDFMQYTVYEISVTLDSGD